MQTIQTNAAELRRAWARVIYDRPARAFVEYPHERQVVERDLGAWLAALAEALQTRYVPSACLLCFAPKSSDLPRPGAVLELRDEVVYNLLVGRIHGVVYAALAPNQGDPDVAYQLRKSVRWVKRGAAVWKQWRRRSLSKLEAGSSYVAVADVAGFYDNIALDRLLDSCRQLGFTDEPYLRLLRVCLDKWSLPRRQGIPQGYTASDVLAKIYLYSIDQALKNRHRVHLRYVDDFRVFTASRLDARRALYELTELLHRHGLSLQSAKANIYNTTDARHVIDGVAPLISDTEQKLMKELQEELEENIPYATPDQLMELLRQKKPGSKEVLERAFVDGFLSTTEERFKATLFHYLLYRLGVVGSRIAVDYCIDLLGSHPEETGHVLRYLSEAGAGPSEESRVAEYMLSQDAIHQYQTYQLLKWYYDGNRLEGRVLGHARVLVADPRQPPWIRAYAMTYLGRFGDMSDLDELQAIYPTLVRESERYACVLAQSRIQKAKRNALFARAEGDGILVAHAVRLVKAESHQEGRIEQEVRAGKRKVKKTGGTSEVVTDS